MHWKSFLRDVPPNDVLVLAKGNDDFYLCYIDEDEIILHSLTCSLNFDITEIERLVFEGYLDKWTFIEE